MVNEKAGHQFQGNRSFLAFLHQIHPGIFPLLRDQSAWTEFLEESKTRDKEGSVIMAQQGLCFVFKPENQRGLDW